jgi:hypothetical protein
VPRKMKTAGLSGISALRRRIGSKVTLREVAAFNGVQSGTHLLKRSIIWIPSKRDLGNQRELDAATQFSPTRPNGLAELCATFGDIFAYIDASTGAIDPRWERDFLAMARLPDRLPIGWLPGRSITRFMCHRLLVPTFEAVFTRLHHDGLWPQIHSYYGCYAFRPQRGTGNKISTHAWGISIDLNKETNEQGTAGDMDPRLISAFEAAGFHWGGRFAGSRRDPMHFQYCTGY